jgi:hypothetical protein
MRLVATHELFVFGSDLYVVLMSCFVAFYVDHYHAIYASILWL